MPEPTQQISIRLPTALLQEIETIAQNANIPRSQAIIEALQRGLGRESRAESQPGHDGAIEELRSELAEAIERIERLERMQSRATNLITKVSAPATEPIAGETFTAQELADRLGLTIAAKNRSRAFRNLGYENIGGTKGLWRLVH
jgi:metal-responsive CopG/Arc/MetJ family transcriptional regulator